jgi:hypothetical protein
MARTLFDDLPDARQNALRRERADLLRQQERFLRIPADIQQQEIEAAVIQEIARREVAPFEKWRLRKHAEQAMLPFSTENGESLRKPARSERTDGIERKQLLRG